MKLYSLYYGNSKKRMHVIMTDSMDKCKRYQKEREHTVRGWHDIRPAEIGAEKWRKKSATVGGNKDLVARINRHGQTSRNGWIGKGGFNQHT